MNRVSCGVHGSRWTELAGFRRWVNAWPRRVLTMASLMLATVLVAGCGTGPPVGGNGNSGGGDNAAGTTTTPPPPPKPSVQFTASDGASGVSPIEPIKATVQRGKITEVVMTNATGEKVEGDIASGATSWSVGEPLGYGKTYTIRVTAKNASGQSVTAKSTFETLTPKYQTYVSMVPVDGQTVGIGMPLVFFFSDDVPAPDKQLAEKAIDIETTPDVKGAFYWFSDRELHWRPKEYWEPGTEIEIDVNIYGKNLGNGVYGQTDRHAEITIGNSVILRANGDTHQMTVEIDGDIVRKFPISLGSPKNPSYSGVHVVMRKSRVEVMDSRSFGLPLDEGGYRIKAEWSTRISNSGEFIHAAPWSIEAQGERNVSHGCINMSTADAKWVFNHVQKGDVVVITNSGGPPLPVWDGFGDWQIPWSEWVEGNY